MSEKFCAKITVKAQQKDESSILSFYKTLISMRKKYPVIAKGRISFLETGTDSVIAYERILGSQKLLVYCNLAGTKQEIGIGAGWGGYKALLESYDSRAERLNQALRDAKTEDVEKDLTEDLTENVTEDSKEDVREGLNGYLTKNLEKGVYVMEPYEFLALGNKNAF